MKQYILTNKQARQFILLKQGLIDNYKFAKEQGICEYIKQSGCIQFDPIDVCGKNAELVLQSRVKGFNKEMLYKLLYQDRKLIDYFDKNMSIFLTEDWKYFLRIRESHKLYGRSHDVINDVADEVMECIREKKFASSKDINLKETVDWAWNPTSLSRAALETLYFRGDLIIHHKKGTIKHYAITEEHLPKEILCASDPNRTDEEYMKWCVQRRIGAVGLLWNKPSDAWLNIGDMKANRRNNIFEMLLNEEKVIPINIENISDTFYCLSSDKALIETILDDPKLKKRMEFIAPLDNMMWDRRLIKAIFNFDYKWEIYTPVINRKYGYYVLPILYGENFIGRIEIQNDKKNKVLIVKNIWLEDEFKTFQNMNTKLHLCLNKFALFNGCTDISLQCNFNG